MTRDNKKKDVIGGMERRLLVLLVPGLRPVTSLGMQIKAHDHLLKPASSRGQHISVSCSPN